MKSQKPEIFRKGWGRAALLSRISKGRKLRFHALHICSFFHMERIKLSIIKNCMTFLAADWNHQNVYQQNVVSPPCLWKKLLGKWVERVTSLQRKMVFLRLLITVWKLCQHMPLKVAPSSQIPFFLGTDKMSRHPLSPPKSESRKVNMQKIIIGSHVFRLWALLGQWPISY